MNVTQSVIQNVNSIPAGKIFTYQDLVDYAASPNAVVKAINRLVQKKRLERFSKGKFYVPDEGVFGKRSPSDRELLRSVLYKDGRLRGYVTGLALFNQLGLTTQLPRTITVAINGGRQKKDFGTIRIKMQISRVPIKEKEVTLLQYLDVLKGIKFIPDADINASLQIMQNKIAELPVQLQSRIVSIARQYYGPQVRALTGMLLSGLGLPVPKSLASSLNPTTTYKLNLDKQKWPLAEKWNIR